MLAGMEFRHLRTFTAAAEARSFTRAAEQLGVTQAAVSQHVAALELSLDTRLFDRGGRVAELTDSGRRLYEYASRILELVGEVEREIGRSEPTVSGSLRIASSTVPSERLLPELLAAFRERYPEVRESVQVSDSLEATRCVETGDADVGFVGERPRGDQLASHPIARDELVLVVAPGHELAGRRSISAKRLADVPLVIREPGSGSRQCVDDALADGGVPGSSINVDAGRLVHVAVRGIRPTRQLYLVSQANRTVGPPLREFLDFALEWTAE